MPDHEHDLTEGDDRPTEASGEGAASRTDGWTADIPRAENAARDRDAPPDADTVQSPEPTQGADPDLAPPPQSASPTPPRDASPPPARDEPSHHAVGIGVIDDAPKPVDAQGGSHAEQDDGANRVDVQPGSHHGQDGGRDTLTASAAQKEGVLGTEQEQRLPAMAQNNASDVDKIAGIVAQTRQDLAATETTERVAEVLAQRFDQSGVHLPESDVSELARQITTGDA